MTKQEFDLKYHDKNIAVHCDTEEKAKAFLELAKSVGYKWSNGKDLDTNTFWKNYKDDLCFSIDYFGRGFIMGGVEIHKQEGYTIVEFELDEPKETFKVGDVVYAVKTGLEMKVISRPYLLESKDGSRWYMTEELLTHKKPLKEISEKELADMGYVLENE